MGEVLSLEEYSPGGRVFEAHQCAAERRFAAARLTDESKGFAFGHGKAHAIDSAHVPDFRSPDAPADGVVLLEVVDNQKR